MRDQKIRERGKVSEARKRERANISESETKKGRKRASKGREGDRKQR